MYPNLIKILKCFQPFTIKAKFQDDTDLPEHIKYIYSKMTNIDGSRYFKFRMDAKSGNKYIGLYADSEYGRYPFAGPGILELKQEVSGIGIDIINRLEDTWWIPRGSFDNWFEVMPSE